MLFGAAAMENSIELSLKKKNAITLCSNSPISRRLSKSEDLEEIFAFPYSLQHYSQ